MLPAHDGHVGIELIDVGGSRLGGDLLEAIGKFPEGIISHILFRGRAFVLDGLRRQEGHARAVGSEDFGNLRLAAHVGAENVLAKRLVGVIIHPEFHGDEGGLERKHIARQAIAHRAFDNLLLLVLLGGKQLVLIRMGTLAQP